MRSGSITIGLMWGKNVRQMVGAKKVSPSSFKRGRMRGLIFALCLKEDHPCDLLMMMNYAST